MHLFGIEFVEEGALVHLPNGDRHGPIPLSVLGSELHKLAEGAPAAEAEPVEGEVLTPLVASLVKEFEHKIRQDSPLAYAAAQVIAQNVPSLRDKLSRITKPGSGQGNAADEKFMRYRHMRRVARSVK